MADRDGAPVIAANNVYRIARYKWHSLHDVTLPLGSPLPAPTFPPRHLPLPLLLCSHDTRQIGGKCSSNRIPLSPCIPALYSFLFFFLPLSLSLFRPIETCFFRTEFLEQFVTIPVVLSPVCNIEILQLVWNFQCFSGETCGSKIRYLIRESAIIMIFIAWIFICNRIYSFLVQDLPRRYFLFLCILYDLLLRNLLRYFFFLGLPW